MEKFRLQYRTQHGGAESTGRGWPGSKRTDHQYEWSTINDHKACLLNTFLQELVLIKRMEADCSFNWLPPSPQHSTTLGSASTSSSINRQLGQWSTTGGVWIGWRGAKFVRSSSKRRRGFGTIFNSCVITSRNLVWKKLIELIYCHSFLNWYFHSLQNHHDGPLLCVETPRLELHWATLGVEVSYIKNKHL